MIINGLKVEDYGWTVTHENIGSPEPRIYTAEVIGRDGLLDMSEVTTGRMQFNNRLITAVIQKSIDGEDRQSHFRELEAIHGVYGTVTMNTDPTRIYTGRITLSGMERQKSVASITITIDAQPFPEEIPTEEV